MMIGGHARIVDNSSLVRKVDTIGSRAMRHLEIASMKNKRLIAAAICLLVVLVISSDAFAQKPYRRYAPPGGPTMTPYLNHFRRDTGGVGDPYNAFVAPQRQLDSQLATLSQQQQADMRATQQQLSELSKATAAPTGSSASFMNYSHYYRLPASSPRSRGGR